MIINVRVVFYGGFFSSLELKQPKIQFHALRKANFALNHPFKFIGCKSTHYVFTAYYTLVSNKWSVTAGGHMLMGR